MKGESQRNARDSELQLGDKGILTLSYLPIKCNIDTQDLQFARHEN